jgi:thiamine biosynthesis lipoprotein ApbE
MAVATSGVTKRKGIKDSKTWHHIIDPASQDSSKTDILTATVVSKSATQADIAAKVMVIEGSAKFIQSKNDSIITSMIQYIDKKNIALAYSGKLELNK